jgi:hypothetical protein
MRSMIPIRVCSRKVCHRSGARAALSPFEINDELIDLAKKASQTTQNGAAQGKVHNLIAEEVV